MIYKEKFKIGLKDVWKNSQVSNRAILEYLENIAAYHSDSVGYGVNTSKYTKLNWLLLHWKVKVIKRPKYGQILDISTWSRNITKCWAYRDFEVYDDDNNLCVIATSKWILIEGEDAKLKNVEPEMAEKYQSKSDKKVFDDEIKKLKAPEDFVSSIKYKVNRKDIDVIGHVHNLCYLDFAYEALPEEVYAKRPFDEFEIMYKKEIKLGEVVVCKYSKTENGHVVVIQSEDGKFLHAIIELKK